MTFSPQKVETTSPLQQAFLLLRDAEAKVEKLQHKRGEPIAIIGLSCRFPGGSDSPESYWHLLSEGIDGIKEIPPDRWNSAEYYDPDPEAPGKMSIRKGGFIEHIDLFDAQFFGISPREAEVMDPQQRLLLELTWEALERAGLAAEQLKGTTTGVFVGAWNSDYADLLVRNGGAEEFNAYNISGTLISALSGRISYFLGLQGPSLSIDTACSSSLVAIHLACENLRLKECNLALACGVNLMILPELNVGLSKAHMLSPDGYCKTFDATANGYSRGEGGGVVVLKRLSDAERDGDTILALIRGSAVNHDGKSSGFTVPNGVSQETVIRKALANAHVKAASVDYIEAHGTGTELGDPIEVGALGAVYGHDRKANRPLLIGTVKSNFGHLEGASGIAGVIKIVLAFREQKIPRNLHFTTCNPKINMQAIPARIPTETMPWPIHGSSRLAAVSSFGVSGTNAHIILEEAPIAGRNPKKESTLKESAMERRQHLLTLSAHNEQALQSLVESYQAYIVRNPQCDIKDMTYTANSGRSHFAHRLAVIAKDAQELRHKLGSKEYVQGSVVTGSEPSKLAFLFTGIGSQYAGMGQQLYDSQPVYKAAIDRCSAFVQQFLEKPLMLLLCTENHLNYRLEESSYVKSSQLSQLSLFASEYALADLWKSWGVQPDYVMGYGIGEYVAATVAGILSLEDALKLASAFPDQEKLSESRIETFRKIAQSVTHRNPTIGMIASLTAKKVGKETICANYWMQSIKESLPSKDGMQALFEQGCVLFLAMGAQSTTISIAIATAMNEGVKRLNDSNALYLPSLCKDVEEWNCMCSSLAQLYCKGILIDWKGFDAPYVRHTLILPTYPFQRERHWAKAASPGKRQQVATAEGHPLLGSQLSLPHKDLFFRKDLNLGLDMEELSYLIDHKVFDAIIFPGAGYVEIALAAGKKIFQGQEAMLIENITFQGLLHLPEHQNYLLQVVATPVEEKNYQIAIYSQLQSNKSQKEELQQWRCHTTCTIKEIANPVPKKIDLSTLRARCKIPLARSEFYQRLHEQGLYYGESFQTVQSLWIGDEEALAELHLPLDFSGYACHPALLDGALQLLLAPILHTLAMHRDTPYLPISIERFFCYRPLTSSIIAHVVCHPSQTIDGDSEKVVHATIDLFDVEGNLLATVAGVHAKQISKENFLRLLQTDNRIESLFYQIHWQPKILPILTHSLPISGTWIVLADQEDFVEQLTNAIAAKGGQSIVAITSKGGSSQSISSGIAIVKSKADIVALLEKLPDSVPLQGIIYANSAQVHDIHGLHDLNDSTLQNFAMSATCGTAIFLYLAQALVEAQLAKLPTLYLVTTGAQAVDGTSVNLAQTPLNGLQKTIAIEHPALVCCHIDLDPAATFMQNIDSLFSELQPLDPEQQKNEECKEEQVAYRQGMRYVQRLLRGRAGNGYGNELLIPNEPHFQLKIAQRGDIGNLLLQGFPIAKEEFAPDGIEIAIKASGLNFRDVLNALGLYPGDPGALGLECAGIITKIGSGVTQYKLGDAVVGFAQGALASHVVSSTSLVVHKPDNLSFAEAATLPVTFVTAYYGLHHLAQLKTRERVLIHAAAGGVGLAAIQLAKQAGVEIFATVGNEAKRHCLEKLGITHIYDSRSIHYAEQILKDTNGCGVDVVLNSLSGEGFIAKTLEACVPKARFIEIGKRNIWSKEQMRIAYPGITYHIIALDEMITGQPLLVQQLLREIFLQVEQSKLQPLPHIAFPLVQAMTAFRTMQQAKHIGKIILTQLDVSPELVDFACDSSSSYFITGGLGGLGLQCAQWLAAHGARHLILAGRHAPDTHALPIIEALRKQEVQVTFAAIDLGDEEEVNSFMECFGTDFPPLKGIIHAAGILDDGVLLAQDWSRFEKVFLPKVLGAWHLHLASVRLKQSLKFFVLFSSIASILGSAGQSNYSAANSFLDALAHYRKQSGLAALSINWGPWSEVGMAVALGHRHEAEGLNPMKSAQALGAMEIIFQAQLPQIMIADMAWQRFSKHFVRIPAWLSALVGNSQGPTLPTLLARLSEAVSSEREGILREHIRQLVRKTFGVKANNTVSDAQGFFDSGMDSLMAMELRNSLQASIGIGYSIQATVVFDYPSIDRLVDFLRTQVLHSLFQKEATTVDVNIGTGKGKTAPMDQEEQDIMEMSSEEVRKLLEESLLQEQ